MGLGAKSRNELGQDVLRNHIARDVEGDAVGLGHEDVYKPSADIGYEFSE